MFLIIKFYISLFVFLLLGNTSSLFGQTRTSVASGNWTTPATWDCNCVPANGDNIVIANGTIVTMTMNETMNDLTVVSGGTLDNNGRRITVDGNLLVDGNIDNNGDIRMNGIGTTISGTGNIPSVRNFDIQNGNQTILAGSNLQLLRADFNINGAFTVLNQGTITIRGDITGSNNLSWVNDVNSTLNLGKEVKRGTITASAIGNTVNYYRVRNQNIEVPVGGTYYNLSASGGQTKTLLGPITVSGDITISNSILDPNGNNITVGGNWTNNYGTFLPGTQTVTFNGTTNQTIGGATPETFYDFVLNKPSGNLILGANSTMSNSLTMTSGNIITDVSTLTLGTSIANPGTFNYTSGTIVGKFERWLTSTGVPYSFPIGTTTNPRNATITFNALTGGTITLEFIESFPGNNGLPLLDTPDSVFNTFTEGYWSLVASNGLSTTDYNISLDGNGFSSYTVNPSTRILTRPNTASNWVTDGSYIPTVGTLASRNNVTTMNAQFAFGDTTSCYGFPPTLVITGSDSVCTSTVGEVYSVPNTPGSIYTWTITGGTQTGGGTTNSITVDWSAIGQVGNVTVQEYTGCRFGSPDSLNINIHSIAPTVISGPISAAQNMSNYIYSVSSLPGYTYNWAITGGTIDAGNGTDTISVTWGPAGTGFLDVSASTGCGISAPFSIAVKIYETINSIASGNWSNNNTWDCSCVPGISNNVVINAGHTVSLTGRIDVNHLLIDAGAILDDGGNRSRIYGDLLLNGTFSGSNRIELRGTNCVLDGTGTFSGHTGELRFRDGIKTIANTAVLDKPQGFVNIRSNTLVKNQGNFSATGDILGRDATASWVQDANAMLFAGAVLMNPGVLIAEGNGNTVNYNGVLGQNIKVPQNNIYYNLTLSGTGKKQLQSNTDINGNVDISTSFNSGGFNINLAGDWTNTGTYTHVSNTITFDGTAEQNIYNTLGETYFNVNINSGSNVHIPTTSIVSMTNTLVNNGTLNNDGLTKFTLGYQNQPGILKGNGTHELTGGNWINNGNFQYDSSTVLFSSTAAQTIEGVTTFYNLTANNAAGVSIPLDLQSIKNTMTVSAGTFTTNNLLSLISDATLTGRIAEIPTGADVVGNVTVNRYIAPAPTSWRFFSTACSGQTLADWTDDIITAGFPGSDFPSFPFISIYRYDETQLGHKDTLPSYVPPTSITDPIATDEAYWVYVGPVPLTFDVTGPINKFAQNLKVTYTNSGNQAYDGWCLVSNPYPSEIDWDAAGWTKTNVNNAIYVWNPSNQQYASYIAGAGTNGGTRYVASQQGFYVQTNGPAPVLSTTEAAKAFGNPGYFKSSAPYLVNNLIKIQVTGNSQIDEIVVRFDENATNTFDSDFDAMKFASLDTGIVSLSSISLYDSLDYSINTFTQLDNDVSIPLRLLVGSNGSYTMSLKEFKGIALSSCFILEDLFTGTIKNLRIDSTYTFTASDTTTVPRFMLHIGAPIKKENTNVLCFGESDGSAIAKANGAGPWKYTWQDSNNSVIKAITSYANSDTLNNLGSGLYQITISGNAGICGSQYDTIVISEPQLLEVNTEIQNVTCSGLKDGKINLNIDGGTIPYNINWANGNTSALLDNLDAGEYSFSVSDSNNCAIFDTITIDQPEPLSATISTVEPTSKKYDGSIAIHVSGGTPEYSYEWNSTFQDKPLLKNIKTGIYSVVVTDYNGCQLNDTVTLMSSYLEEVSENGLGIYPNPATDETNLLFQVKEKQDVEISIYSMLGNIVLYRKLEQIEGSHSVKLNLDNFASGLYEVQIQLTNETRTEKLTVR